MSLIPELGGCLGNGFRLGTGSSSSAKHYESTARRLGQGQQTHFSRQLSLTSLEVNRRAGSGDHVVTMMQTAKPWHRYDPATHAWILLCFATRRRSLRQREMRPVLVIVTDVLVHETFQMAFIDHDHMVEQIPAAVTDPTLCNTVLPRTPEAGSFRLYAKAHHRFDHFFVEVRTAIEDQVSGGSVAGTREEHKLITLMFTKQEQHIKVLIEILKSKGIIEGDDAQAYEFALRTDVPANAALALEVAQRYTGYMTYLKIPLPISQEPDPSNS